MASIYYENIKDWLLHLIFIQTVFKLNLIYMHVIWSGFSYEDDEDFPIIYVIIHFPLFPLDYCIFERAVFLNVNI